VAPQRSEQKSSLQAGERPPTMADVARLAQVSTAAVSYFLSGQTDQLRRVGAEAQERIREAVETLGYVRNKTARHLRLQRTERICLLMPKLGIPFADKMAHDVDAVAHNHGFSTIVVTASGEEAYRRVLRDVEMGLADGVIADANGLEPDEISRLFETFSSVNRACLVIHPTAKGKGFSVLNYDWNGALSDALEHLVATGHTRVAYIQNRTRSPNPRARLVRDFIASRGLPEPIVLDGAQNREAVAIAAREIAAAPHPRPTAVLVESDFTAVTVIEELQRRGLSVPGDVAVIGCGNAEEGYYCNPRLTTIGPTWLSITEAAEHLIDIMQKGGKTTPRRFTIPWTLYIRESG
jgi:LacI family repressor for deo operon, udp, cdd, tsx, nupC, and nupG